jgi:hypothetical protein
MGCITGGAFCGNVPKKPIKWIDGDQNEIEMAKLEANLKNQIVPRLSPEGVRGRKSLILNGKMGWLMGLEPTTTGITILDSTN